MQIYYPVLYFSKSCYSMVKKEPKATEKYGLDHFGYGETLPASTWEILSPLNPKENELLIDLGCGRGIMVLSAHFIFKMKGIGVDIISPYIAKCNILKKWLKEPPVEFLHKDLLDFNFNQKGIYYIAATSFEKSFMPKLEEKLKQIPYNSIIIIVHNPLKDKCFELFYTQKIRFTWGQDQVYYYRKAL